MSESTLSSNRAEVLQAVGDYFGFKRNQHAWSREETATVTRVIRSGERQYYSPPPVGGMPPHSWSFLRPRLGTTISAPYATGTIAIVAGTATLTGGTWPSWAADGWLVVDGVGYSVASRSSSSVIVLDDSTAAVSSGTTYSLQRYEYTLPDAFGGFIDPFLSFVAANNQCYVVQITSVSEILRYRQFEPWSVGIQPVYAAVVPKSSDGTDGQRQQLLLFPTPTEAGTLDGVYYAIPNATTDAAPYPLGGEVHAETYLAAIMAAAELEKNKQAGPLKLQFMERLAASIAHDKRIGPKFLGYNGDRSDGACPVPFIRAQTCTYNGVPL